MDLGECLEYTDEECPNCGRMRVERWSSGKHICEKCYWCVEDEAYYREEDEVSYIDAISDALRDYTCSKRSAELGILSNDLRNASAFLKQIHIYQELIEERRKSELDKYADRAALLGVNIYEAEEVATKIGISIERYLSLVESLIKWSNKNGFNYIEDISEEPIGLSDVEIRKQLKYEKNPMRIKELNKMLSSKVVRKKKRK